MDNPRSESLRPSGKRPTVRQATKWAFVQSWGSRGIATLLTLVLAALLGPDEFGVMAMAMLFVAFVEIVLEQGLTTALIQRKRLRSPHLDSAFWLIMATSIVLLVVVVGLREWWARVYKLPALGDILLVLSALIPLRGLVLVQQARLQRRMRFRTLALIGNSAVFVGGLAGVASAIAGAGVWALVVQKLAEATVALILFWSLVRWRPRLRFSWPHARGLLGFSVGVFFAKLGVFGTRWADVLLMGLFFGPTAVGLYRLASRLTNVVVDLGTRPLQAVALPHYSNLQDQRTRLRESLRKSVRAGAIIIIPGLSLLAALAIPITTVLGPKWADAATPMAVLCLAGLALPFSLFVGPLLLAVNRPYWLVALTWVGGGVNLAAMTVVAIWLREASTLDQVTGLAWTYSVITILVHAPINIAAILWLCRMRLADLLVVAAPSIAAAVVVFTLARALGILADSAGIHPMLVLALVAPIAIAAGVLVLLATDRMFRETVQELVHRKRGPGRAFMTNG